MLRIFILLFVLITKGIDMSSLISFFKKTNHPSLTTAKKPQQQATKTYQSKRKDS